MGIQTRGFGIDVMPRFTPADPNAIASNPNLFTEGVLSAYKLKDIQNKLKAFQLAQDELAATSQSRVLSQNAQNNAIGTSAMPKALAEVAVAKKASTLAPAETGLGLLNIDNQSEAAKNLAKLQSVVADTQLKLATGENQAAHIVAANMLEKANAEAQKTQNELQVLEYQYRNNPMDLELGTKLKQATVNAEEAKTAASNAMAKYHEAVANFTTEQKGQLAQSAIDQKAEQARLRAETAKGRIDTVAHEKAIGDAVNIFKAAENLDKINLGTKEKPLFLPDYEATTRDESGELKKESHRFGPDTQVPLNPAAEALLKQRNMLREHANRVLSFSVPIQAPVAVNQEGSIAPSSSFGSGTPSFNSIDEAKAAMPQGGEVIINGQKGVLKPKSK